MDYSAEYKKARLRSVLPPSNEFIIKIAKEEAIAVLFYWGYYEF